MTHEELFQRLQSKLEGAEGLNSEAREELLGLMEKLRNVPGEEAAESADEEPHGLARVRHYVEELEASHPELAAALGQVANTLSKMGI